MTPEEETNLCFIDSWLETYNAKDAESFAALYAHDAEMVFASRGLRAQGPAEILEAVRAMLQAFPDREMTLDHRLVSGNVIALEGTFRGTSSGARPDVPAGETLAGPFAAFVTLRDGKLVSEHTYA